jgi:hypothetical protein
MNVLKRRIRKLEMTEGRYMDQVILRYIYEEGDGLVGETEAKTLAIAEWESVNGILDDAKLHFIARRIVN